MAATTEASGQLDGVLARLSEYHLSANERELQVSRVLLTSEYKDLLQNAGYKRADSLPVRRTEFPESGVGIYTRSGEKTIDVLVETDLMQEKPGISYVSLPDQRSYDAFREDLQYCLVGRDKVTLRYMLGSALLVGSISAGLALATLDLKYTIIGVPIVAFPIVFGGAYFIEKKRKKSQERILSLHPETNPALALKKALGHQNY